MSSRPVQHFVMARREHDREDLLAEARALVERIALRLPGDDVETVVGFRRDGSASFYFGPERVYHFTSTGALRRAHVGQALFKAEHGRLVSMVRHRTANAVELVSRALDAEETTSFLAELRQLFDRLCRAIERAECVPIGQVPADADIAGRIAGWLARHGREIAIARSPRVG
jgi:hypothetical protein